MLKINIVTLFPELIKPHLDFLPFKKAIEQNKLQVNIVNLREYALDNYGTVDSRPYGGGVGMVLMIEPIYNALSELFKADPLDKSINNGKIIALSPRGKTYNQDVAKQLLNEQQITLICGRYEGMDARVEDNIATDIISIGNFVVSGGEVPALAIMESIVRLIPGILEKSDASEIESFSENTKTTEFPQYTRPENFRDILVPKVLLSGNHKEIEKWKQTHKGTTE